MLTLFFQCSVNPIKLVFFIYFSSQFDFRRFRWFSLCWPLCCTPQISRLPNTKTRTLSTLLTSCRYTLVRCPEYTKILVVQLFLCVMHKDNGSLVQEIFSNIRVHASMIKQLPLGGEHWPSCLLLWRNTANTSYPLCGWNFETAVIIQWRRNFRRFCIHPFSTSEESTVSS